jgi:hypothetical protein
MSSNKENLVEGHHAGIAGRIGLLVKGVDNPMDVLESQTILVAVLDKAFGGIDHEYTLASRGIFLVEHKNAGRDAAAVKQLGRQPDNALQVPGANKFLDRHLCQSPFSKWSFVFIAISRGARAAGLHLLLDYIMLTFYCTTQVNGYGAFVCPVVEVVKINEQLPS